MPSKNYANIALEGGYGTPPSSGWTGLLVREDTHQPNVLETFPQGIFYGQEGPTDQGIATDIIDAKGTLKPYLPSTGIGLLLMAMFGSPVSTTTLEPGAFEYVFETGPDASELSLAAQIGRTLRGGGEDRDTYAGGMPTEWRIEQPKRPAQGGQGDEALAKCEFDMDYQTMLPGTAFAQKLPTYPNPELYHGAGSGFSVAVGPDLDTLTPQAMSSFSFKYNTGLDTEDTTVSSTLKAQPTRSGQPEAGIDGEWNYAARDLYDAWLNGSLLAARAKWEPIALEIAEGVKPSLTIDVPRFKMGGEGPQMSLNEKTKQKLPMRVLKTDGQPMLRVTYVTTEVLPD